MKRLVLPGVTLNKVRRPRNLRAIANIKTQKTTGTPVDEKVVEEPVMDTIVDKELTSETTVDEKVVEEHITETPVDEGLTSETTVDEKVVEEPKKTRKKKES